eukprot:TRINITY_DN7123_c0_g1_i1.p1 TRINITY_DN7123_c0_g1~~TRINITY_DN7123_c0_g1_i1.p1  ORF type:complete len:637 (+),score=110.72 TRINITY_DN7123_c0_g1_i1:85-1995(+)
MSSPQRVVVYLGASAPVHITHMRLVRSLLDEGHDRIFIFLLRWRPERFGTSPDAGAEQLQKWLAALPADELARVSVHVAQHESDGGRKMREVLGPDADPEVEVCFSNKYENQQDRIKNDWLPLYTGEFPRAMPRFLTPETDPGSGSAGTAQFADVLKAFRDAQGTADAEAATAELDKWRPDHESTDGWSSYVKGLLQGARGEPFYSTSEKNELDQAFFADTEIMRVLDSTWRNNKLPGGAAEFLKDKANWGAFWKKHATAADETLRNQFCLRKQGVIAPSALELMPQVAATQAAGSSLNAVRKSNQRRYVILAAPAMHSMAERIAATDPGKFEYHLSKWRKFPDGTDNITLGGFEPEDRVSRRDVLFLCSLDSNDTTLSQLHALTFLCESAFLSSLTILLAFLPSGTMERYLQPGRVAAANTTAKLLSQLPPTGGSRTRVMIYDIHALPTQYFFQGSCAATLHTAGTLVIDKINSMDAGARIDCIAFPDDGAAKRFSKFFSRAMKGVEIVTCNKVRTQNNQRVVVVSDGDPTDKHVLIVDDLIQTGGTMYECAAKLKAAGAKSVTGYVTHAVFPGESWKRFLRGGDRGIFERFWLTSSNPAVCKQIPGGDVFEIIDLAPRVARDLEEEPSGRSAWS